MFISLFMSTCLTLIMHIQNIPKNEYMKTSMYTQKHKSVYASVNETCEAEGSS